MNLAVWTIWEQGLLQTPLGFEEALRSHMGAGIQRDPRLHPDFYLRLLV